MSDTLEAFVARLPKAELHLHIEGTLEPELLLELARRNQVAIPYPDVAAARRAYQFHNLQSFLDVYYPAASVLRTAQDFYDLASAYLRRAAQDGVRHAEIFFDPQTHTMRGVPLAAVVDGLADALADAGDDEPARLSTRLIMCFLRHLDEEEALATFDAARPFLDRLHGVGLDSSELGHPPSNFQRVFARARAEGLHVVAHAGEEGPPSYIWEALDLLGAERIDHGVRCLDDPELVRRLADQQVPLTVCPLSNVKLQVFNSLAEHNLPKLVAAGLRVTINSDDPAYFGGYVADNYVAIARELGFSPADLVGLAANSIRASFLEPTQRDALLADLERSAG